MLNYSLLGQEAKYETQRTKLLKLTSTLNNNEQMLCHANL